MSDVTLTVPYNDKQVTISVPKDKLKFDNGKLVGGDESFVNTAVKNAYEARYGAEKPVTAPPMKMQPDSSSFVGRFSQVLPPEGDRGIVAGLKRGVQALNPFHPKPPAPKDPNNPTGEEMRAWMPPPVSDVARIASGDVEGEAAQLLPGAALAGAAAFPKVRAAIPGFINAIKENPPVVSRFGPAGLIGAGVSALKGHSPYLGAVEGAGLESGLESAITGTKGAIQAVGRTSNAGPSYLGRGQVQPKAITPEWADSVPVEMTKSPYVNPQLALPAGNIRSSIVNPDQSYPVGQPGVPYQSPMGVHPESEVPTGSRVFNMGDPQKMNYPGDTGPQVPQNVIPPPLGLPAPEGAPIITPEPNVGFNHWETTRGQAPVTYPLKGLPRPETGPVHQMPPAGTYKETSLSPDHVGDNPQTPGPVTPESVGQKLVGQVRQESLRQTEQPQPINAPALAEPPKAPVIQMPGRPVQPPIKSTLPASTPVEGTPGPYQEAKPVVPREPNKVRSISDKKQERNVAPPEKTAKDIVEKAKPKDTPVSLSAEDMMRKVSPPKSSVEADTARLRTLQDKEELTSADEKEIKELTKRLPKEVVDVPDEKLFKETEKTKDAKLQPKDQGNGTEETETAKPYDKVLKEYGWTGGQISHDVVGEFKKFSNDSEETFTSAARKLQQAGYDVQPSKFKGAYGLKRSGIKDFRDMENALKSKFGDLEAKKRALKFYDDNEMQFNSSAQRAMVEKEISELEAKKK